MLRLIFMGSDPIALPLLDWLARDGGSIGRVVAVYTQPDRPAGRGQQVQPNAIKRWALAHGLPVHQPAKLDATDLAALRSADAEVALVLAYGHILKPDFIAALRLGTLNLHASLLPRYRGASPIQTAIANGDRETGVSLMRIVPALDAGPVAEVERVPIGPLDTAAEIETALAQACVPLLARTLPALATGRLVFTEQDHAAATYCRRLEKGDGAVDFHQPAPVLAARINGLMPWPACTVPILGQPVKLGLADCLPAEACHLLYDKSPRTTPVGAHAESVATALPGTVLGTDGDGLLVAAGAGVLRLRRLQRPGGKMLPAADFLRGFPLAPGTVLPSVPLPSLVAREPFPVRRS